MKRLGWLLPLWVGCGQDATVSLKEEPVAPVQQPPTEEEGEAGAPPDWNDCATGYLATFYNLPSTHPDVEPEFWEEPDYDPNFVDWWDATYHAFEEFQPSLEMGDNWWPVDQGLDGDPAYWSGRFNAWIRVQGDGPVQLSMGASTDVWVLADGDVVARQSSPDGLNVEVLDIDLESGQYPLEIRFAHRFGPSALRLRFVSDNVAVCFAEYDANAR